MKYRLNYNSPTPLYYQIKRIFKNKIDSGEYQKGDRIPSENELALELEVSKPTIRKAIEELANAGYVSRQQGKGTFVTGTKIDQGFVGNLEGYSEEMSRRKLHLSSRVLEHKEIKASSLIAEKLKLREESSVIKLARLRFIEGEAIIITTSYLPAEMVPGILNFDFSTESLYSVLEREYGYSIARGVRSFEPLLADKHQAELLEMEEKQPVQYIESITYLNSGEPVEYIEAYIKGSRSRFTVELVRNRPVGNCEEEKSYSEAGRG